MAIWKRSLSQKSGLWLIKGVLLVYLLVSLASCTLVLATGFYGGKMVYTDGVGVKVNGTAVNPSKAFHKQ